MNWTGGMQVSSRQHINILFLQTDTGQPRRLVKRLFENFLPTRQR